VNDSGSALIRTAREADSAEIGRIHVAAWRETYRGLMPDHVLDALSEEKRAAQWQSGLARGAQGPLVFVAEAAPGSLNGFIAAGPVREAGRPWHAEVYALYLLRSGQGRGLGYALMRRLASALGERERRTVGLWVLTANAHARAFYERIGAAWVDQRMDESEGWACDETAYVWEDFPRALGA
jgi:ribosomal protein S18 acetylase RimI-like enzyme